MNRAPNPNQYQIMESKTAFIYKMSLHKLNWQGFKDPKHRTWQSKSVSTCHLVRLMAAKSICLEELNSFKISEGMMPIPISFLDLRT